MMFDSLLLGRNHWMVSVIRENVELRVDDLLGVDLP